jgi:hypothetical protein
MNIIDIFSQLFCNKNNCKKEKSEIKYLNNQIKSLTKAIGYSIKPIEITVKPKKTIKPYLLIKNCVVADLSYNTFTLDDWKNIIKQVYDEIQSKYVWTENVFDCDNVAFLYNSILSYSVYKSNMKLQPALGIAWSNIHAFNIFITDKNEIYLYEPQNNKILSLDEGKNDPMYDVKKVWFMI